MVHLILLLLLMTPLPAESFVVTAVITAISFAYSAYNILNDAHDTYQKFAPQTTLDDVLDQARRAEKKVDQIGAQLSNQIGRVVGTIITHIEDKAELRDGLKTLSQGIRRIDNLYRIFEMHTSRQIIFNNYTLQDYIHQVTTFGAFSPKDILNEIYDLIIPSNNFRKSLIYYLKKYMQRDDMYACGSGIPAQGNFYQIFRLIMVNEVRTFIMLSFAYSLNQAFKCESSQGEIQLAVQDLRTRAMDYYNVFLELGEDTANTVRSCDPPGGWVKGLNFYELERFKTEYLVNQKLLRPDKNCSPDCEDLQPPLTVQNCNSDWGCDPENTCDGNLYDCQTMSGSVTVCQLGTESKRYEWYSDADDVYGDDTNGCSGTEKILEEKNDCDICLCTCADDSYKSKSLRTFSFREQIADIANNKVVTGIKFVVEANMVHIQIQEGVALTEGRIVPSSVNWKLLARIQFDGVTSGQNKKLEYYWIDDMGTKHEMKELEDFLAFDWYSHIIYLDNLIVPTGHVVTGARFNTPVKNPDEMTPLQLEIQATPFDYDSGKIIVTDDNPSIWLTPKDMVGVYKEYDREREPKYFYLPQNPEHEKGTFIPSSEPNSYLRVETTSMSADGGQTVIPFLDAQEIVGKPAFAAGGIGIYLKTATDDGGGFLAFRLYGLQAMKNIPIQAINKIDKYSQGITAFKGCNKNL